MAIFHHSNSHSGISSAVSLEMAVGLLENFGERLDLRC